MKQTFFKKNSKINSSFRREQLVSSLWLLNHESYQKYDSFKPNVNPFLVGIHGLIQTSPRVK
jgi:hypothetical protein